MKCDALLKGTSVDGVYNADPKKDPGAVRYDTLSYDRVLADNLKVMDASAVALCSDNHIPIVVFNIREPGNLARVLEGEGVSTVVGAAWEDYEGKETGRGSSRGRGGPVVE